MSLSSLALIGLGGRKAGGDIVSAPTLAISDVHEWPTDAHCRFAFDNNGNVYTDTGQTAGYPANFESAWCTPGANATNYEMRMTRTGGTETVFTLGSVGVWENGAIDNVWRLSLTGSGNIDIIFTIDIRRKSDSVIVATSVGNSLTCESTP